MEKEKEDLEMLERIFLGIVMAESDEKFEKIVNHVLPSLIEKLASPSESIRNKVMELLTHITKRVKAAKQVQLPMDTLVSLYSDPGASAFITNFTIIYLKVGLPRLTNEKKFELLPKLLATAENKPLQQQESLLVLLITSIRDYNYPRDENKCKEIFGLGNRETLKKLLLSILMDVFMFPYGCTSEDTLTEISTYSYQRLIRDGFFDTSSDSIEKLKIDCLKLVSCGLFPPSKQFPPLVLASADPRSSVSNLAEDKLKKIFPDLDTSKRDGVDLLYMVFLGIDGGNDQSKTRRTISVRVRLKILQYISKFTYILWPVGLKVLFESLYGDYTNQRIRMFALNYAAMIIQYLEEEKLKPVAHLLMESALLKLLKEPELEMPLRERAFPIIGQLVRRCPVLVVNNLHLLTFMFDAIEEAGEGESARVIRDAAIAMSEAFKASEEGALPGLLESKLTSRSQKASSLALNYVIKALKPSPLRVYLLLYATCLNDEEVRREARKSLYSRGEGQSVIPGGFPALLSLVLERETDKPHPLLLLKEVVNYLRIALAGDAGVEDVTEPASHPSEASPLIRAFLTKLSPQLLDSYLTLLFRLLSEESGVISLSALLEIIGCLYPSMADRHLDRISTFKELSTDGASERGRELAAEIWGALASRQEPPPYGELESHVSALGHLLSRLPSPPLQYLNAICKGILEGGEKADLLTAISAVSLVAQSGKLHLPPPQLDALVDKLLHIFYKNEVNKAREKAITAVGYICIAEIGTKLRTKVVDKLLESPNEVKETEIILASGQTLVSAIMGSDSPLAGDPWTREKTVSGSEGASGLASSALEKMLTLITKDRRPTTRQTLCFWLLAITKHCATLETVKITLSDIQGGFLDLLNDNNGLTQEGAGKGLALVYEAGDEKTRGELVKAVVEQLSSGKRLGQVSSETKLFEEGELGETPTGEKLSTYKELCTLASDLNQPDLIYKFMALAHHNAIWNSKKGAAFTVASLAQKAGPELQGHLPSVLVRLFRYQYDPVSHVRQAMSGIWSSLASKDTAVKYRKEIFDDLLSNLTAREWRVRYSSCRALADLMKGPAGTFLKEERKDRMGELWRELFRVMDDIHKDTRLEATRTALSLSKICAIPEILPIILEKGVTSQVAEVRILSLSTINEMMKKGLPEKDVVTVISAYLKSEIDIKSFVQYVKVGMMEELSGALIDSLKHSVRGGRVSAANFITLLSHHLTLEEIQPYVGKFLGALLHGAKDKNRRIRQEYGSTIGHLLRCAKASSVERLFERLTTLYLESYPEDEVKWGVTEAVISSIRHSQEVVEAVALPLVFLAKHEAVDKDKTNLHRVEKWEEALKQICPGVGRLTTYQAEISTLLVTAIQSQFWPLKAQGGRSARTLVEKVTEVKEKTEQDLLQVLSEALDGRVWSGKEALLSPLPFLGSKEDSRQTLLREAGRGSSEYKSASLEYLAETKPPYSLVSSVISESLATDEKKLIEAALALIAKSKVEGSEVDEVVKICSDSASKAETSALEALSEVTRDRPRSVIAGHVSSLLSLINTGLGNRKQARSRRSALNILNNLQISLNSDDKEYSEVKSTFEANLTSLEGDTDAGVRSRCAAIKENFKEINAMEM